MHQSTLCNQQVEHDNKSCRDNVSNKTLKIEIKIRNRIFHQFLERYTHQANLKNSIQCHICLIGFAPIKLVIYFYINRQAYWNLSRNIYGSMWEPYAISIDKSIEFWMAVCVKWKTCVGIIYQYSVKRFQHFSTQCIQNYSFECCSICIERLTNWHNFRKA